STRCGARAGGPRESSAARCRGGSRSPPRHPRRWPAAGGGSGAQPPSRTPRPRTSRWPAAKARPARPAERSLPSLPVARLIRGRTDPHPRDPMLVYRRHLERPSFDGNRFAGRGDVPEEAEQKPGESLVGACALRHREARLLEHLVVVRPAGQHARLTSGGYTEPALIDLADDLLEDVLIGDDAGQPAVLIDHRHQLDVLLAH